MTAGLVFDIAARADMGPASFADGAYAYLNRSARPIAGLIRDMLETWLAVYPIGERDELVKRLRSDDAEEHESAFFELMLHELMRRRGFNIAAVHPVLPHTEKTPDFLIETPSGEQFLLEALVVMGRSDKEAIQTRWLHDAIHVVESVKPSHHFLSVRYRGAAAHQLPLSKLAKAVEAYVVGLPEGDLAAHPPLRFEKHGLRLDIRAARRFKPAGANARSLGGVSGPAHFVVDTTDAREKLKKKITRYGKPDIPYVIAVNHFKPAYKAESIVDVMFGAPREAGGAEQEYTRDFGGLLFKPTGPQNTRVSAVLACDGVNAWSVPYRRATLIRNPWTARPAPAADFGIDQMTVSTEGASQIADGASFCEIFGLDGHVENGG